MRKWLFTKILRSPQFRGKHRILKVLRSGMSRFRCRMKHGFDMELDCFEWTQLSLAQYREAETSTTNRMLSLLAAGDTYVDVGAHVGYLTLIARTAVGGAGTVIAIEPQPYNCEHLLRNWELNSFSNLRLHVAAASDFSGFVALPQQAVTDKARLSLAVPMHDALNLSFEVPKLKLSDVLEKHNVKNVKLLKVDVEGYESEVLAGLGERALTVDNVIFEALAASDNHISRSRRTCEWLRRNHFTLHTVTGQRWNDTFPVPDGNLWAMRTSV